MNGACSDESMDTSELRAFYRFARGFYIFFQSARKRAHTSLANGARDLFYRVKVPGARRRKTGLDNIYAQLFKLQRKMNLLVRIHRRSWALLAVTKRRIEDYDFIFVHYRSFQSVKIWQNYSRPSLKQSRR